MAIKPKGGAMSATYEPPADLVPGELDLTTVDGNAGAVMGAVARSLKRAGNDRSTVDAVRVEMMSGDYNHLLQVAMAVTADTEEEV